MTARERTDDQWAGKENAGSGLSPDPKTLTDEALEATLDALCARRDALLKERAALNLPPRLLYEGQEFPPAGTLDGDLHRLGQTLYRHHLEYVTRSVLSAREEKTDDTD